VSGAAWVLWGRRPLLLYLLDEMARWLTYGSHDKADEGAGDGRRHGGLNCLACFAQTPALAGPVRLKYQTPISFLPIISATLSMISFCQLNTWCIVYFKQLYFFRDLEPISFIQESVDYNLVRYFHTRSLLVN
jgi:hypothetical protein